MRSNPGSRALVEREQDSVIQRYYDEISDRLTGPAFTSGLSRQSDTPIPGSESFGDHSGGGDVANYRDRIEWIETSLWPAHQRLLANPGEVERLLQRDFDKQVERYRKVTPGAIGEDVGEEVIEGLEKAGEIGKHALPPVPRLP